VPKLGIYCFSEHTPTRLITTNHKLLPITYSTKHARVPLRATSEDMRAKSGAAPGQLLELHSKIRRGWPRNPCSTVISIVIRARSTFISVVIRARSTVISVVIRVLFSSSPEGTNAHHFRRVVRACQEVDWNRRRRGLGQRGEQQGLMRAAHDGDNENRPHPCHWHGPVFFWHGLRMAARMLLNTARYLAIRFWILC